MHARRAIHEEIYNAQIQIEARTMSDMIRRQILPAVSEYAAVMGERVMTKKNVGFSSAYEEKIGSKISVLSDKLMLSCEKIDNDLKKVPSDSVKAVQYNRNTVYKEMVKAREIADELENLTDRDYWPFPVYADLLFSE